MIEVLPTAHIVVDGEARREITNAAANRHRILHDIKAEHARRSTRGVEEAEQRSDCRALPSAVWAEEAEEFALADLKAERLERLDLAVAAVVL